MSRILRRPMFRGGRVDSRGTGITSGLGYEKGGRVGLRYGGNPYKISGYSPRQFAPGSFREELRALGTLANKGIRGIGFNAPTAYASLVAGAPIGLAYLNRAKTDKGLQFMKDTDPSVFDETAMEGEMEAYSEGLRKANEQGNKISFLDNFFLDPETGTYPKFMGRQKDRDTLAALAAAEEAEMADLNEIDTTGNVAGVREGETALDAVMREAFARKNNRDNTDPKLDNEPANPEIDKDTIKKYKDMFREAYGSGRGEDISNMLMSFAGKALKPEATVKSAFGEFFEEEGKRPSKRKQYDEAAATAAINAYIAGEKSMADTKKALAIYDKKLSKATSAENSKTITTRMNEDKGTQRSDLKKLIGNTAEFMEDNNIPGVPQQIKKEQAEDPALLTEENIGTVFIDTDSKKVFMIIVDSNGQPVKRPLYSG